jgi:hypothetical protein
MKYSRSQSRARALRITLSVGGGRGGVFAHQDRVDLDVISTVPALANKGDDDVGLSVGHGCLFSLGLATGRPWPITTSHGGLVSSIIIANSVSLFCPHQLDTRRNNRATTGRARQAAPRRGGTDPSA